MSPYVVSAADPGQEKQDRNRGAALWGNFVITAANYPPRIIATDKDTGKVVWETGFPDTPEVSLTSAVLPIGDNGVRDWMAGLDAKTGKMLWRHYTVPAPGEPGSETWKGNSNAWRTAGGAVWATVTYRSGDPADPMGNRQSGADVRPDLPSRRQPLYQ